MSDILESIKAAYEEGFDDGMQMHRSDFDERWDASNAKLIYDSMKSARESEGGEALGLRHALQRVDPLSFNNFDELLGEMQRNGITCNPQPDKWIPCSERLPTEDDGFIWVYSTHTKAVLWRPQTWRDINMWTEREKCLWMAANLRKPIPPEQEPE